MLNRRSSGERASSRCVTSGPNPGDALPEDRCVQLLKQNVLFSYRALDSIFLHSF